MEWYRSRTLWSLAAGMICMLMGRVFHISDEQQKDFTDWLISNGGDIGAAIAMLLAGYFRINAKAGVK